MHILNLDTIGGVETLYINFLKEVWRKGSVLHMTSISGKKAHPLYQKIFSELRCRPFYERKILGLFLPKALGFLSHVRRWMLTDVSKASLLVFWNRIETDSPSFPFLYYEHGASWNLKKDAKHLNFFDTCQSALCVSEAAKQMLEYKISPSFPINVLPNPLRPDIALVSTPKTAPKGKLHLGFIGRLSSIKAPSVALFTLEELIRKHGMEAHLTIAGTGREKSFLVDLAKKLNLLSHITFIDRVEQIEQFYDTIDILLVPSVREPLGLVALEASARGVPIVATCVDGLYESVLDGQTGLLIKPTLPVKNADFLSTLDGMPEVVFDPLQKRLVEPKLPAPSDCAEAIIRIVQTELFDTLSRGGIEHARSRADFHTWCSSLLSCFRSVVQDLSEKEEKEDET